MESASSSSLPNPDPHSSSNPKPQWIYDVFINFRGEDTRKKFVCHLYHALSKIAGVNTFLDEEKLLKGMQLEELLPAIEGSQIAIVVFSKNYTESSWCLGELEKIIECHQTHGLIVVPVFYYVDPSDVRHQKGAFGEVLKAHAATRYSGEQLERELSRWNTLLIEATSFSGWDVRIFKNEAELVKEIVNDVHTQLDYKVLSTTKFPVGLESREAEVIRFIKDRGYSCIIGIWGMGGSGKTTLAKAIYNQIHRRFMRKSFIEDISRVCDTDRRGQVCLQEKLLSDILKTKVEITSIGMGITMIDNKIAKKETLIVLDDVNESNQLTALCGNTQWVGQGGVMIITTRDLHLLKSLEVEYVYEMKEMDENESLELFSQHAFREAKPREGFDELARIAVAYCGGLPLALKVLGSELRVREKDLWTSELSKLKSVPNANVLKNLRISFDGLSDQKVKDIFLDVCCAFIGKDKENVIEILNGCGLFANIGIAILIERNLIKVEKNNELGMHHLLRQMGRDIIHKGSTTELGKCSRLWFQQDVLHVLKKNIGTEAIQGLALKLDFTNQNCFKAYAFQEMKKLRLLQLDHVQLSGDYGFLSKELRWVCWEGFPSEYIPNNFDLKGVIAIDLRHSHLRLVWENTQVLQELKILNLSHSKYLTETPNFSGLPSLEKLILEDCPSLRKVHQSIGDLHNLLLINLKNCTSLNSLPIGIYKLKSLKTLIVSGCSNINKNEEDKVQQISRM